jgi:ATP-dependent helicase YprA (DUF1998 family)
MLIVDRVLNVDSCS